MKSSFALVAWALCAPSIMAAEAPPNLARDAAVSASESQGDLLPQKAVDGDAESRWSGIPGHNAGVWYQLEWKQPTKVGEVIVHQFDRFAFEWDVQVRKDATSEWQNVQHLGRPGERLPLVVACRFTPQEVSALRIGNITNGPSFTELEVHDRPYAGGITTSVASDLRGNLIGMVTDCLGSSPVESADVAIAGHGKAGPWEAKARSNDKGLFFVPLPLGLEGQVKIQTSYTSPAGDIAPVQTTSDLAGFQYGLTPRGISRVTKSLNGQWKFCLDPPESFWAKEFDDSKWANIMVPGHWEMAGFHSDNYIGGYRLRFKTPSGAGRTKLRFEGVYSGAEVWVNGQLVAVHEGGATPFECDLTDVIGTDDNVLAVRVKEHTTPSDRLDHMSFYADFPLAGIFRDVSLIRVPEVHIGAVETATTFDRNYRDATLAVRVVVLNESSKPFHGRVALNLFDAAERSKDVASAKPHDVELGPWKRADLEMVLPVSSPRKWEAEHPNLYLLNVQVNAGSESTDQLTMVTGFRQTEIRGAELLINGQPIKLRGTCHHDGHPLTGRSVTADLQRRDIQLMQGANLNALRTSHYPPTPELLDLADEMGMYVEDEASFCWASGTNDLRNTPRILQLEGELLARDRNHACVPFWSICNESEFGYGFERAHEWVRTVDPSRPNSAATSAWLEIATLHNPLAIARIDANENLDKPLIFDESLCIYQGIFGDVAEMWVDPGMRDYYAQPQPAIYDRFIKSKATQGSMIWCWADDLFCVPGRGYEYGRRLTRSHFVDDVYRMPGRGIVGDAPWGVVDGWRREKPEYWITKKLHSPVKVKETPLALPAPGEPIRVALENQYDFSNLSELNVQWAIAGEKGVVRADVPARSAGQIEIRPSAAVKDGQTLALTFENAAGRVIDSYLLPLGHEPAHVPSITACAIGTLKTLVEESLAEPCATVAGQDFRVAFDRGSGMLRRGVVNGHAVMQEFPVLHVLPTNRPMMPLPDLLTWQQEKFDIKEANGLARISITGHYQDFKGGYEIEITPAGEMTVVSAFEYTGNDILAREVGLRFSVSRDIDVLEWDHRGEWTVYPADHIGRPRGTTRAYTERTGPNPPTWSWSEDNSPMGSNDFRSTKRNIYWAGIHSVGGPGVVVQSDGSQHLRAAVDSDRISIHVNDWFGGTNVGWGEWITNYGRGKPIHKGERLTSKVTLKLVRGFDAPAPPAVAAR